MWCEAKWVNIRSSRNWHWILIHFILYDAGQLWIIINPLLEIEVIFRVITEEHVEDFICFLCDCLMLTTSQVVDDLMGRLALVAEQIELGSDLVCQLRVLEAIE